MRLTKLLCGLCLSAAIPALLTGQNPPPPTPPVTQPPPPAQPTPVVTPAAPTAAQAAAAAALGKQPTNEQISDAIKNSGLSEQQIRDRLKGAGYDPSIADPFFVKSSQPGQPGQLAPTTGTPALQAVQQPQAGAFAKALSDLGILSLDLGQPKAPEEKTERSPEEDLANRARGAARAGGVFGKDVFSGSNTQFDPVVSGPVDASYRIGVGDQLQLIVTGQIELGYSLEIRRDGTVVIPQVGQISIAGLTMEGARTLLKARMARSYSGLASGEASLDLTISRVRSNSVFVIGEVEHPGAYQVNALSTVFHALTRAGGPTSRGSFRRIEVRRAGETIRTIDLYDYLLRGDGSNDIRTEEGDFIFVPLDTRAVAITGAVRRPGVFELKENESFNDLLAFAGGLLSTASLDRVQIDRILPPERRQPGFERVKLDIQLHGRVDSLRAISLHDSDIISVFSIGDLRRNTVSLAGAVFQPGDYEFTAGMTLDSLLRKSEGPLPTALTDRIKVRRAVPSTGRTESFSLDLADSASRHFPIAEFDQVLVLDGRAAYPGGTVSISGAVRRPFTGPFSEHARLRDVIDLADGFAEYALMDRIKVERPIVETGRDELFSVDFRSDSGKAFPIARGDKITVLDARTAYPVRTISVSGAVFDDGTHPFVLNESLKDAIDRAGGFREEAASVTVARRRVGAAYTDTTSVVFEFPIDVTGKLAVGGSSFILAPDDHIMVRTSPGYRAQRFATVEGMFIHPGSYAITENEDRLRDLIARAGGTLPGAYGRSFKVTRDGKVMAIDFDRAINGDRTNNVFLRNGDVLSIEADPRTVFVTGAVSRPTLVVYRSGLSALDYVELAGGPSEKANRKGTIVEYPSGYSRRVRSFLGVVYSEPEIVSGSVITVPTKPESTTSSDQVWARVFAGATALATLIVSIVAIKRL